MARIKRGILGGFSGKVGAVIGSSWKGIETMRSMPISVPNPRTQGQVNNRNRFKLVSALGAGMLTTIVKPLNDRFAVQMSGFNAFCKRNSTVFNQASVFAPAGLSISVGKLGDTPIINCMRESPGEMSVNWDATLQGSFQRESDAVYVAILLPSGEIIGTSSAIEDRQATAVIIPLAIDLEYGHIYHVYLAFARADGTIVSNTSYYAWDLQP